MPDGRPAKYAKEYRQRVKDGLRILKIVARKDGYNIKTDADIDALIAHVSDYIANHRVRQTIRILRHFDRERERIFHTYPNSSPDKMLVMGMIEEEKQKYIQQMLDGYEDEEE